MVKKIGTKSAAFEVVRLLCSKHRRVNGASCVWSPDRRVEDVTGKTTGDQIMKNLTCEAYDLDYFLCTMICHLRSSGRGPVCHVKVIVGWHREQIR